MNTTAEAIPFPSVVTTNPMIPFNEVDGTILQGSLVRVGAEIVAINNENGWNVATPESWETQYKVPAVLALIHSEVSEALEAYRAGDHDNFAEEMADVFIRVLDLTHGLGIDLGAAVLAKMAKNRTRGYRHGGKRV